MERKDPDLRGKKLASKSRLTSDGKSSAKTSPDVKKKKSTSRQMDHVSRQRSDIIEKSGSRLGVGRKLVRPGGTSTPTSKVRLHQQPRLRTRSVGQLNTTTLEDRDRRRARPPSQLLSHGGLASTP
eukprot:416353_1